MPFRDRVRRAFGGGHSASDSNATNSPASTSSPASSSGTDLKPVPSTKPTPDDDTKGTELKHIETAKLPPETKSDLKPVDTKTSFRSLRKITSRKPKKDKEAEKWKDWPENIYKPHEMPRPRYRRPADPKHTAHLESYTWDKAFGGIRRNSKGSLYSPMGSRLPSRLGSIASRRSGGGNKSVPPSRSQSVSEVLGEDESEGGGVENVGLSRHATRNNHYAATTDEEVDPTSQLSTASIPDLVTSHSIDSDDTDDSSPLATSKTVTKGDNSQSFTPMPEPPAPAKPFSEEELVRALSRTKIVTEHGEEV